MGRVAVGVDGGSDCAVEAAERTRMPAGRAADEDATTTNSDTITATEAIKPAVRRRRRRTSRWRIDEWIDSASAMGWNSLAAVLRCRARTCSRSSVIVHRRQVAFQILASFGQLGFDRSDPGPQRFGDVVLGQIEVVPQQHRDPLSVR